MTDTLILVDIDKEMVDAWESHCGNLPGVRIHHGDIFEVGAQCYVSPANSFGFMDGGIDQVYLRRWPWIQERIQSRIENRHVGGQTPGEILVGEAELFVASEDEAEVIELLICAPTMRVPMALPKDSINPYLAAKAALNLMSDPGIGQGLQATIAMPGLGTGCGRLAHETVAKQIKQAFREVVLKEVPPALSWSECVRRQTALITGDGY